MFKTITHACITVSDMKRSEWFYGEVLGMEQTVNTEIKGGWITKLTGYPDAHLLCRFYRAGETQLELIQYLAPLGSPVDMSKYNPGVPHICFEVDDIHAAWQHFVSKGIKVEGEPVAIDVSPEDHRYMLYAYDPDGVAIELVQYCGSGW